MSLRSATRIALPIALAIAVSIAVPYAAASSRAPLRTGLSQYGPDGPDGSLTFSRMRSAGASVARIIVSWSQIAPASRPVGFDPANPYDPSYNWYELDRQVNLAAGSGLEPFVVLFGAPQWAEGGPGTDAGGIDAPDPVQLGQFALAAARRYDGTHPGLPLVRAWGVWNEPNVSLFMQPQTQNGQLVSVTRYREMINAVASAAHSVRPDNVVVAGELFPNEVVRPGLQGIGPLTFLRSLFCLSGDRRPRRICRTRVNADAISVHPYASGGPAELPANRNSVWIGNLPSMRTLIVAAQRVGSLISSGPVGFWVTEFGWNTNPPRSGGVPVGLDARWISEALYRMWNAGVSLASYFNLRDDPVPSSIDHSGLYYACPSGMACDQPKPALAAFRFPFVAFASHKRTVRIWGRAPMGIPSRILIQRAGQRAWRTIAAVRTDGNGIFSARLRLKGHDDIQRINLRATLPSGPGSLPFSLRRPPRLLVTPFA